MWPCVIAAVLLQRQPAESRESQDWLGPGFPEEPEVEHDEGALDCMVSAYPAPHLAAHCLVAASFIASSQLIVAPQAAAAAATAAKHTAAVCVQAAARGWLGRQGPPMVATLLPPPPHPPAPPMPDCR